MLSLPDSAEKLGLLGSDEVPADSDHLQLLLVEPLGLARFNGGMQPCAFLGCRAGFLAVGVAGADFLVVKTARRVFGVLRLGCLFCLLLFFIHRDVAEVAVVEGVDAGQLGFNCRARVLLDSPGSKDDLLYGMGTAGAVDATQRLAQVLRGKGG